MLPTPGRRIADTGGNTGDPTLDWYTRFAAGGPGQSALYTQWAAGIVGDAVVRGLLEELPRPKRQPHLVFAVSRLLGAPELPYPAWREWVTTNWPALREEIPRRTVQTNEAGRCAPVTIALGLIAGPIALLEVGSSAGICLYPDRYSYDFDGTRLDPVDGPSAVLLHCAITGEPPLPVAPADIVWRAGIDLSPLDVTVDADRRWLDVSVGPEQVDRRERLHAALDIVRLDPPRQVAGDASDQLAALAASAPAAATLVILSAGVLVYLSGAERTRFDSAVAELQDTAGARWISLEGAAVLPAVAERLRQSAAGRPPEAGAVVLALDEHPLAWCSPHGYGLNWLGER